MRRLALLSVSLLVAGCATAPKPAATPEPVPETTHERGTLVDMTADDLVRTFGTPVLQIREGNSLKLQFRNPQCVLDAYLYPGANQVYRVTHVDTRTRAMNRVDQAFCIRSLQAG
jgi:hypothetical protein